MELDEHGFLEDLLSLRRENLESFPSGMSDQLFYNGWSLDGFNENRNGIQPFEGFDVSVEPSFDCSLNNLYYPFEDSFQAPETSCWYEKRGTSSFPVQEDIPLIMEQEQHSQLHNNYQNFEKRQTSCKLESIPATETPVFDTEPCDGRKKKNKKVDGQPSKNLMAERRRRKRLNERLSMLRSVVPRISKMDRTSILGDTIDYMKELIAKIKNMQEGIQVSSNQLNFKDVMNDLKPNEMLVRNAPKFEVERRNKDTRVEICCAPRPGLLLSNVNTLEVLGLEIEQCVISCFNDFAMQASCSEGQEKRGIISSEDLKQAFFSNAGYGGRCI